LLWFDPALACAPFDNDVFLRKLTLDSNGKSVLNIRTGPILDGSVAHVDFYGELLTFLKKNGYAESSLLFTFPYDWRLSNEQNATGLRGFIESIVMASGQNKVDIVAHSMGGLVARRYAALARSLGEDRLNKLIYLGTPQIGAPNSFGPLAFNDSLLNKFLSFDCTPFGSPFGLNVKTLAEVSRTFPSAFQLLPRSRFIFSTQYKRLLTLDESYLPQPSGLGLLKSSLWVGAAQNFHDAIHDQLTAQQYNIVGSGTPTLNALRLSGDPVTGPRVWCAGSASGDGRVTVQSATAIPGTTFFLNKVEHDKLPNNSLAQQLVLKALRDDLSTLPPGVLTAPSTVKGVIEWCSASPIRVNVIDEQSRIDGIAADGSLENQIPLSNFFVFEENEGGFLIPGQQYSIQITALGMGVFSLTFNERDDVDNLLRSIQFTEIPIAPTSKASFQLFTDSPTAILELDIDGDGSPDFLLRSNQAITPGEYIRILKTIMSSLGLEKGIEGSMLAKVDAAASSIGANRYREGKNILGALLNEIQAQKGKKLTATQAIGLTDVINHLIQLL